MTKLTVYKQLPAKKPQGSGYIKKAEPIADHIQYVCEVNSVSRDEKQRFFGDSLEKLARTVGLNVQDNGVDIQNGTKYQVRGVGGDPVKTEMLDSDELVKFQEFLRAVMKRINLPRKK